MAHSNPGLDLTDKHLRRWDTRLAARGPAVACGPRRSNPSRWTTPQRPGDLAVVRLISLAWFCVPSLLVAQVSGPYRLPLGDTIRYREVTSGEVLLQTPQGPVPIRSEHDGTLALVGTATGSAQAWFEALRLRSVGPNGDQSPSTGDLLGRPYELSFTPSGLVVVRSTPAFPEPIAAITDLSHQFFDFFAAMPETAPVAGSVWQDTIRSTTATAAAPTTSQLNESIRRFEVRGDTTIYGTVAKVISVTARVRMEATTPLEGQPLTVTTSMAGEDTGLVIFDWSTGRLLFRSRRGELTGTFRIDGGPQPAAFPQSSTYDSTIEILQ